MKLLTRVKKATINTTVKTVRWATDSKWKMMMLVYAMIPTMPAMASSTPEDKWNQIIDFIVPWISKLGGVVILIGAVEFGLAFKNDDAEGKTKGMRTIIAGCIVTAVASSYQIFL